MIVTESFQRALRIRDDVVQSQALGKEKAGCRHVLDLRTEGIPESIGVHEDERFAMEIELALDQNLGDLLEGAEASWQGDERIPAMSESALSASHVADELEIV